MSSPWKRRLMKTVRWGIPTLCTMLAVLITVTIGWRPVFGAKSRPLTSRQFERTPERLARGKYLGDLGNTPGHVNHWSRRGFLGLLSRRFEIVEARTPLPWTMALCKRR